jgi:hypothetical protein
MNASRAFGVLESIACVLLLAGAAAVLLIPLVFHCCHISRPPDKRPSGM